MMRIFFFVKQKTAYEMRISDWSSDVCSSDLGARIEKSKIHAAPDADLGNGDLNRRFTTVSASAGASGQILDGWRIGANVTRSARAPSAEALFAHGPPAGPPAFEIGNPGPANEQSCGRDTFPHDHRPATSPSSSLITKL